MEDLNIENKLQGHLIERLEAKIYGLTLEVSRLRRLLDVSERDRRAMEIREGERIEQAQREQQ